MLYRFVCGLSRAFFRLFYSVTSEGLENVPKEGGLFVCCNHISMLDMFLFGPRLPRKIYFMAKQELFKIPLLKGILRGLAAYPVNRGHGDLQAAKTTLKLLQDGKAVGIFPEGRRTRKIREKVKPKSGAILFALDAGVPVLPVGIFGSYRLFSKIRVVYGKPYSLEKPEGEKVTKTQMQDMVEQLMEKIYSLGNS